DQQFERRLNRRILFSTPELEEREKGADQNLKKIRGDSVVFTGVHSEEDMLKIARALFPAGEERSWKLLAAYALGKEKKQASGIANVLDSARFRATKAGRGEAIFADIKSALIHDHGFLSERPAPVNPAKCWSNAQPLQKRCKAPARPLNQAAGPAKFPLRF